MTLAGQRLEHAQHAVGKLPVLRQPRLEAPQLLGGRQLAGEQQPAHFVETALPRERLDADAAVLEYAALPVDEADRRLRRRDAGQAGDEALGDCGHESIRPSRYARSKRYCTSRRAPTPEPCGPPTQSRFMPPQAAPAMSMWAHSVEPTKCHRKAAPAVEPAPWSGLLMFFR